MIFESAAEETRFLGRDEFEKILPVQDNENLLGLIRRIVSQTSRRFSRIFGISFPNIEVVSYSDPDARAMVQRFNRIPADAFVLGDKILVNLASNEVQRTIQDVIVHELAHKVYDQRHGDLSFGVDSEDFADVLVKGFSRDPGQPFNPSTAPQQYQLFQRIMSELTRDTPDTSSMVTARLNQISSSLESRGFIKEAQQLDILSNTIDRVGLSEFSGFKRGTDEPIKTLREIVDRSAGYREALTQPLRARRDYNEDKTEDSSVE